MVQLIKQLFATMILVFIVLIVGFMILSFLNNRGLSLAGKIGSAASGNSEGF